MEISIIEQGHHFMVLLRGGFTFPEGRSFRNERTIEDATALRRDLQNGRIATRPIKQPHSLFEASDEFAHPSDA